MLRAVRGAGSLKTIQGATIGAWRGGKVTCNFALSFVGDAQLEPIEAVAGEAEFYTQALPGDGYAVRFHHLGRYFPSHERYSKAVQRAKSRWATPVEVKPETAASSTPTRAHTLATA